jgi:HTH-type transcriptional regulator / antitoxin HigA
MDRDKSAGLQAAVLRGDVVGVSGILRTAYTHLLDILSSTRALTLESPAVFQPRIVEACAAVGVVVVFVPELPGARVCGATRWLNPNKALIQLSLRYKTNDHLWCFC